MPMLRTFHEYIWKVLSRLKSCCDSLMYISLRLHLIWVLNDLRLDHSKPVFHFCNPFSTSVSLCQSFSWQTAKIFRPILISNLLDFRTWIFLLLFYTKKFFASHIARMEKAAHHLLRSGSVLK